MNSFFLEQKTSYLILVHPLQPNANSPPMSFQLLHLRQLHDRPSNIPQTLCGEIRARYVLDVGSEINTGVLLCVSVGGCLRLVLELNAGSERERADRENLRKE